VRRGSPVISVIVSRRRRGIATRICNWVLRAVVARARLETGRWRWRPTHSVIIYIAPANRGRRIIAVVSRRRYRPSGWRIIVWVTRITGRGRITSRRVLFTIRRILPAMGRGCCIVTRRMNSIDQRTVARRAVASRSVYNVIGTFSGPVTHLAALETCTRIPTEFCKTSSTTRYFHTDFIAHEKPFIIFGDTFLGRFATLEFHETIPYFQFNVDNTAYFSETTLKVLLTSVFG
jgi:hypothetical protein